MSNLWDRPPLTSNGDADENITFSYVGRVLNQWEALEFELSRLYSWFCGKTDDAWLEREYGNGRTFSERADILTKKARECFVRAPDQEQEAKFDDLLKQARGYAGRRNDIAHGMLFPIHEITLFKDRIKPSLLNRPHHAIIPPLFAVRSHTSSGYPEYAYASNEMRTVEARVRYLRGRVERFRLAEEEAE